MKATIHLFCFAWALLFSLFPAYSDDSDAGDAALKKFASFRPTDADLRMYQLDWHDDFLEASTRARAERRPILLIIIHARYGDITSGHC